MVLRPVIFLFFLVCLGCNQATLLVQQQKVSSSYLASGNVGTPDPRTPPSGQMILAEWWVPKNLLVYHPFLKIDVLFKDFSQEQVEFPITRRAGFETFAVLNDEFKKTGGLLAYRVEIVTDTGEVYADWTHQLWVKLIELEDETKETSSAMAAKSRHASVTETPSF